MKEGTKFGLYSVRTETYLLEQTPTVLLDNFLREEQRVLIVHTTAKLMMSIPLAFDMQPYHEGSPFREDHFYWEIEDDDEHLELCDRHTKSIIPITMEQMRNPEFDIVQMINDTFVIALSVDIEEQIRGISPE